MANILESIKYAATPPQQREEKQTPRWTLKRLVEWLKEKFDIDCCRETVRKVLKKFNFSWKKARKLLNKANPEKRQLFVKKLAQWLKESTEGQRELVYIDEAHIHLDTAEGYGWSVLGERFWVSSSSPGLQKVSFYGVYFYNQGQVKMYPYACANGEHTVDVLKKIKESLPDKKITLIWDGASYHRSGLVKDAAEELDIEIEPLPGYSPDFMPVEHLWAWLREDVTYHTCYDTNEKLIHQVEAFEQRINAQPTQVADRLWTKTELDPSEEKLRFST